MLSDFENETGDSKDTNNNEQAQEYHDTENQRRPHLSKQREEPDESRTRILDQSQPVTSYGGLARRNSSNGSTSATQHQKAPSTASTAASTTTGSKKKRVLLTSSGFSHQRRSSGPSGSSGAPDDGCEDSGKGSAVAVSDIIGSFGLFQLVVLLFSGLREGLVGYDALIMSLILQPETNFQCAENVPLGGQQHFHDHLDHNSTTGNQSSVNPQHLSTWNRTAQCYRCSAVPEGDVGGGLRPLVTDDNQPLACRSWIFQHDHGRASLVADWSLVCQHHWLIAFIESAYFFGLVTGNLTWGYCADKFGRRPAYLVAHTISLVFGALAILMPSPGLFALCRFLAAFGSVGYNIIYSIQVELIGAKHRSFSTILNHMGWGLGVISIPLVDRLFDDYRPMIALVPLFSLFMYPWAFWMPESSRWLMAKGRYAQARRELIRAAKFNGISITPKVEKKLWALEQRVRIDKLQQKLAAESSEPQRQQQQQLAGSYKLIFTSRKLLRDTLILAYLAFVGHLFYYVQTINFAYVKNLSTEANFITSGAGEWVSVIVGAVLLKFCTRKTCMSLFLLIMAGSFAFQSLIESELLTELDTVPIITTNNGLGTLSSLLLVFITLIVNQEVYPTVVRQTGSSITNTVGELGSTLAPLVIHLSRLVGPWEANVTYTLLCASGILFTQFLTRTDDIELPDT